jgi:hypothetical protein
LFLVTPGENVFLRQDEAVRFALRQHAETIFKEKKTPIDPPKGNFTFVNRCGITGRLAWPAELPRVPGPIGASSPAAIAAHALRGIQVAHPDRERSRGGQGVGRFDELQDRVRVHPRSRAESVCDTRDELEKHFVENHLAQFVTSAPEVRISGTASRQLQNPALLETIRLAWEQERKFPLKTANEMRGRLRHEGFHFFQGPEGHHVHQPHQAAAV